MTDPVADERAALADDLALLEKLQASLGPEDAIALQACEEVMRDRHARLEGLDAREPSRDG